MLSRSQSPGAVGRCDTRITPRMAGFQIGERAAAFLLDRGKAADEIARRDGVLADGSAIGRHVVVRGRDLRGRLRGRRPPRQFGKQSDEFGDLLEYGRSSPVDDAVEEAPRERVSDEAARGVRSAALAADREIPPRHRNDPPAPVHRGAESREPLLSGRNSRRRSPDPLDEKPVGGASGGRDRIVKAFRLRILAPEPHEERSAYVRMARESEEEPDGVIIVVAAAKTDAVRIPFAAGNLSGDETAHSTV